MPLLSVNALSGRLARRCGDPLELALTKTLASLPADAPVVILVHGFRFSPSVTAHDPHEHILASHPTRHCWKALSWPTALGLTHSKDALAIAFGWEARGSIWQAYESARTSGRLLADLVRAIRARHAGPVSVLTHSLGARVALQSLHSLDAGALDRILFMAGAEFGDEALAALASPCGRSTECFGVTARENEMYDFLLERFLRRAPGSAMGGGLGTRSARWLDVRVDEPRTASVLARLGYPLGPARQRICHWSVYLRPGVFEFYKDLLLQPRGLPYAMLQSVLSVPKQPRTTAPERRRAQSPLPALETAPM